MPPVLHQHPFASFCQKALIAFYELDVPFETVLVEGREEHLKLWPLGTIPVLVDGELVLPESTSIIEHIDDGRLTADPQARLWDRLADNHLDRPMQKIVTNYLRPTDSSDPYGVEEARAQLDAAYAVFDARLNGRDWLAGDAFTVADCAAAPALFYCRAVHPWDDHTELSRYFRATLARPSVSRVVEEARPYRPIFPPGFADDFDA
jgi:glutathione S-transferase